MPLVVLVGTPCSGKTKRAFELKQYFEDIGKQVDVVSEEEAINKLGYKKNETYMDAQKEKRMRGVLKSEVIRIIGKDNLVILDGSNYIKGFRYELYCASKASKSTQCTIYTIRNHNEAQEVNRERREKERNAEFKTNSTEFHAYTDEVFEALTKFRFEEPNGQNRWDSPLFTVQASEDLDMVTIHKALYENKPPPPNMSTQNPPLGSTNFLYDLDQITQGISAQILDAKRAHTNRLPNYADCQLDPVLLECATPQRLLQLRRQFLTYARQHFSGETPDLGRQYIRYLNNTVLE